jgi:hypothetical protein
MVSYYSKAALEATINRQEPHSLRSATGTNRTSDSIDTVPATSHSAETSSTPVKRGATNDLSSERPSQRAKKLQRDDEVVIAITLTVNRGSPNSKLKEEAANDTPTNMTFVIGDQKIDHESMGGVIPMDLSPIATNKLTPNDGELKPAAIQADTATTAQRIAELRCSEPLNSVHHHFQGLADNTQDIKLLCEEQSVQALEMTKSTIPNRLGAKIKHFLNALSSDSQAEQLKILTKSMKSFATNHTTTQSMEDMQGNNLIKYATCEQNEQRLTASPLATLATIVASFSAKPATFTIAPAHGELPGATLAKQARDPAASVGASTQKPEFANPITEGQKKSTSLDTITDVLTPRNLSDSTPMMSENQVRFEASQIANMQGSDTDFAIDVDSDDYLNDTPPMTQREGRSHSISHAQSVTLNKSFKNVPPKSFLTTPAIQDQIPVTEDGTAQTKSFAAIAQGSITYEGATIPGNLFNAIKEPYGMPHQFNNYGSVFDLPVLPSAPSSPTTEPAANMGMAPLAIRLDLPGRVSPALPTPINVDKRSYSGSGPGSETSNDSDYIQVEHGFDVDEDSLAELDETMLEAGEDINLPDSNMQDFNPIAELTVSPSMLSILEDMSSNFGEQRNSLSKFARIPPSPTFPTKKYQLTKSRRNLKGYAGETSFDSVFYINNHILDSPANNSSIQQDAINVIDLFKEDSDSDMFHCSSDSENGELTRFDESNLRTMSPSGTRIYKKSTHGKLSHALECARDSHLHAAFVPMTLNVLHDNTMPIFDKSEVLATIAQIYQQTKSGNGYESFNDKLIREESYAWKAFLEHQYYHEAIHATNPLHIGDHINSRNTVHLSDFEKQAENSLAIKCMGSIMLIIQYMRAVSLQLASHTDGPKSVMHDDDLTNGNMSLVLRRREWFLKLHKVMLPQSRDLSKYICAMLPMDRFPAPVCPKGAKLFPHYQSQSPQGMRLCQDRAQRNID